MHLEDRFARCYEVLTGHHPFPWQRALYHEFVENRFPLVGDIPTGLGKTAVIPIWLLALAEHASTGTAAGFPRRLVYVVNRRTVVDQATSEAEKIRDALLNKPELHRVADALRSLASRPAEEPVAISTLRGQFADNAEWRSDPARPAVIVGTIDMIGSRLLFSGYGRGFKSRPLHAGFLGQDALLVHDEAHLEPAFQELLLAIAAEQARGHDFRPLRILALTATSRAKEGSFGITSEDREDAEVATRLRAKKGIDFHAVDDKGIADEVVRLALEHKESGQAILVFLRRVEDVKKVASHLGKKKLAVQVLTGTIRGLERDSLASDDLVFARFLPRPPSCQPGTVYVVCTSAGEVGVDISADHAICDLAPFDSMAQRLGRVNRFGRGDARIDVVHEGPADDPKPFDRALERTIDLLRQLPQREDQRRDASPEALGSLPLKDRQAAFSPGPAILPTSDILFDAWTMTSIRQPLPGRPPVADWLHGVADWEPPETRVAWRSEVALISGELLESYRPEELLEDYPLKPHELLRDATSRVLKEMKEMAERGAASPAWLIDTNGAVTVLSLAELVERGPDGMADSTVLLPPAIGGLRTGFLAGDEEFDDRRRDVYDVADRWREPDGTPRRLRLWDVVEPPAGMRLVRTIDFRPYVDDGEGAENIPQTGRFWSWFVRSRSADDDASRTADKEQELGPHLESAERWASELVTRLALDAPEAMAVRLAARWHDLGKNRAVWQRSIGNADHPRRVLAKSSRTTFPVPPTGYRHEFGTLLDLEKLPEFLALAPEARDLVEHLVATHHGRARPHFPADEAFDPERRVDDAAVIAREVPRRFARLQRKYGRWGIAYLESLVRAADALASQAGIAPTNQETLP